MSGITIRTYDKADAVPLADILDRAFGSMERWTPEKLGELASPADPARAWVALEGSRQVGCVRVHPVPRADGYVIRELAVDSDVDTARRDTLVDKLLGAALDHLKRLGATYVRASTPILPPYAEAYRRHGFTPVRRALTLMWDLSDAPWSPGRPSAATVHDGGRYAPELLAELYVAGMRPFWDWWIDECGGADGYKDRVAAHWAASLADDELWLVAELNGSPVGLAGVADLDSEEADFQGLYVLPASRVHGAGSALLEATLDRARGRTGLVVVHETITALDADIPSTRLYRRSGARQRAEYLHLQRM